MAAGDEEWHTILLITGLALFVVGALVVYYLTSDDHRVRQAKRKAGHQVDSFGTYVSWCFACCLGPIKRQKWERENLHFSQGYGKADPRWEQFRAGERWQKLPRGDTDAQRKTVALAMAKLRSKIMGELLEEATVHGIKLLKRDMQEQSRAEEERRRAAATMSRIQAMARRMEQDKARLAEQQRQQAEAQKLKEEQELIQFAEEFMLELAAEASDLDEDHSGAEDSDPGEDDGRSFHENRHVVHQAGSGGATLATLDEEDEDAGDGGHSSALITAAQLRSRAEGKDIGALADEFSNIFDAAVGADAYPASTAVYNRAGGVLPVPSTRVVLRTLTGVHDQDYINANHISSATGEPNGFIVTQEPIGTVPDKEPTLAAFWTMIWENKASIIVALQAAAGKGAVYWPTPKSRSHTYGGYTVSFEKGTKKDSRVVTSLLLTKIDTGERRPVIHHNFMDLQDTPPISAKALLAMLAEVREASGILRGPVVMVNSTGSGAIGVLLALEYGLFQMEEYDGHVDMSLVLENLRSERSGLVDTLEQYKFLYRALAAHAGLDKRESPPPAYVPTPRFDEHHEREAPGFDDDAAADADAEEAPADDHEVPGRRGAPVERLPSLYLPATYDDAQAEFSGVAADLMGQAAGSDSSMS